MITADGVDHSLYRVETWLAKKRVSITLWVLRVDGGISGFIFHQNPGPGSELGFADYPGGSVCLQIASLFFCLLNNLLGRGLAQIPVEWLVLLKLLYKPISVVTPLLLIWDYIQVLEL